MTAETAVLLSFAFSGPSLLNIFVFAYGFTLLGSALQLGIIQYIYIYIYIFIYICIYINIYIYIYTHTHTFFLILYVIFIQNLFIHYLCNEL